MKFTVKVIPNASRDQLVGWLGETGQQLKIKVAAPPEKGKANQAVKKLLAKQLGVKLAQITILSGQTNSVKQIEIIDFSDNDLHIALNQ